MLNVKELKSKFDKMNDFDIAEEIEIMKKEERILSYEILEDRMPDIFSLLSIKIRKEIIKSYDEKKLKFLVNNIETDDLTDVLQELPESCVSELLKYATEEKRKIIQNLLKYPKNSAGSIMSADFIATSINSSTEEILEKVKDSSGGHEHNSIIYTFDDNKILNGYIFLSDVIKCSGKNLKSKIKTPTIYVHTMDDQEEAARLFNKYKLLCLPVLDENKRMVGIITSDDILDVISEEVEEDFSLMAGISQSEEDVPYLKMKLFPMIKERIGRLIFLMISATFTGLIIERYQKILESQVLLAAFIPVLMDSGGNAGSQVSTIITRSLSLKEISAKDIFKVVAKEAKIGIIIGFVMAIVNFIRLLIGSAVDIKINLTVCITLIITILISKIIGGMLPLIADFFHKDPAVMAGPLLTTIVDTFTLIVYFNIARILVGI
ncbi:MAG: magnesium transporter [Peptoniphilaceae bacterium]|nr:magnesium transporter [Peptoniphilaceae bacterium]MDD7383655.1 magnesium transporter [Peptoniphilaceae bacterium]MDY3737826.1 magnesium transporter [Peptoniphilaceae bacterium]